MKYFLFCVIDCIYLIILFKKYNKGMWSIFKCYVFIKVYLLICDICVMVVLVYVIYRVLEFIFISFYGFVIFFFFLNFYL